MDKWVREMKDEWRQQNDRRRLMQVNMKSDHRCFLKNTSRPRSSLKGFGPREASPRQITPSDLVKAIPRPNDHSPLISFIRPNGKVTQHFYLPSRGLFVLSMDTMSCTPTPPSHNNADNVLSQLWGNASSNLRFEPHKNGDERRVSASFTSRRSLRPRSRSRHFSQRPRS
jgi:hypothetical protein